MVGDTGNARILAATILLTALAQTARGQVVLREDSVVADTVYADIDLADWDSHPCGSLQEWYCGDVNFIAVGFEPWPFGPAPGPSGKVIHHYDALGGLKVRFRLGVLYAISVSQKVEDWGFYPAERDPCVMDCTWGRSLATFDHLAGSTLPVQVSTWGSVKALYER